jgi:hypothetical protein
MMVRLNLSSSCLFNVFREANHASTGRWRHDIKVAEHASLETSEENLEGRNKDMFLAFMRGMLQWQPEDRKTAKGLLQDPWPNDEID